MHIGRVYAGGLTKFEPREMERIPVPDLKVPKRDDSVKSPPVWTRQELDDERKSALEHFRQSRHTEPLDLYLELFDDYRDVVEEVLEQTVDLARLREEAVNLLADKRKFEVIRYLSGPPVSEDDLKILIQAQSLTANRFKSDPALVDRLVTFIQNCHDRRRFPWINESWEPEEHDRNAAILATTALLAMRRLETLRRSESKLQERLVATQLRNSGFKQVPSRRVQVLSEAPKRGEYCDEAMLGTRKADFLVGPIRWSGHGIGVQGVEFID